MRPVSTSMRRQEAAPFARCGLTKRHQWVGTASAQHACRWLRHPVVSLGRSANLPPCLRHHQPRRSSRSARCASRNVAAFQLCPAMPIGASVRPWNHSVKRQSSAALACASAPRCLPRLRRAVRAAPAPAPRSRRRRARCRRCGTGARGSAGGAPCTAATVRARATAGAARRGSGRARQRARLRSCSTMRRAVVLARPAPHSTASRLPKTSPSSPAKARLTKLRYSPGSRRPRRA